jgi:multiple sugar transport system substrate-binding protein
MTRNDEMTQRVHGTPIAPLPLARVRSTGLFSLLATLLLLVLSPWAAAQAPTQSERALDGVRKLVASGEVGPNSTLRLGFKQGNISAYLGNDLELQKEWEEKTGIILETRIIPQQTAQSFIATTPGIDLTVARNHEFPELIPLELIEDLTPYFAEFGFALEADQVTGYIRPDLQAYLGDRVVAVPADGDVIVLYLRRDLLEKPSEKAAFRKATGRELAPPETWAEYEELAGFFQRPGQGLFGVAEERDEPGAWMFWLPRYYSQARPYQPLFDDDMRPLIDSPQGVAATESYAATVRYGPPGITDPGKDYSFTLPLFLQGKAFALMNTIAAAKLFNAGSSPVRNRFMVAPIPGTRIDGELVRRNTIIYGNNLVVPKSASKPKLAFLYAMWITSPEVSARSVGVRGGFTDPYRWSHLKDPRIEEIYTRDALEVFARSWDTALPPGTGLAGDSEYLAVLDANITAVARGEIDAATAMRTTSAAWEEITDRLGRAEQIRQWRANKGNYRVTP